MGANKFTGILAIIVIAGTISLAVVHDSVNRKVKDFAITIDNKTDASTWLATPESLFDGNENMKLKPLLGPMSGAVALHYQGPSQMLAVNIEYWKDGVKTNISSGMGTTFQGKNNQGNYQYDGDFVYSFQDRHDPSGTVYSELVYAFISESGYASTAVRVDKPAGLNIIGEMRLQQKEKVPLDESTIVWGLQGTDKQQMLSYSSIAETLQSVQWAMVVRVGFNANKYLTRNVN
ncbi:hypothetical protein [Paenibacillus sp. Root444D2]|uniref:hypothetical protein n=1 Tax=Paenibacillus sp. Root444D2 TaxID=1736538 RepID=UPI00070EA830|nr:hypothetical protein [Paenibacillus sp. Root444D2]KQX68971.1 hypothetical protein ASD40_00225 [Paenibacillus sp. Root444D2]